MHIKILKNKPLIEAIFEMRWKLFQPAKGVRMDPHYKLLLGRIYEKVKDNYPFHEQLGTAIMPDEIAGYVIQHRFRASKNKWPLIQIGPGIITLNETEGYLWEDFEKNISNLLNIFFKTYPDIENLKVNRLLLRYIDAIEIDYRKNDIFKFLKEKMKMNINVYPELFNETGVNKFPKHFDLRFSFRSKKPAGIINLRFVRGKKMEMSALIWETWIRSIRESAPNDKKEIISWIKEGHVLTDDWFFKIIEGDLLRRFE